MILSKFSIRRASPEDVEAIRTAHRKSILELAAKDYPPEIVAQWGTNTSPESIQKHKNAIADGEQIVWVAAMDGQVEGFSTLVPATEKLGAIYVTGKASGKGVGKALLEVLEAEARRLGLKKLSLDSSITARTFYEKHGYRNLGHGFHEMRSGAKMECYFMEKVLAEREREF